MGATEDSGSVYSTVYTVTSYSKYCLHVMNSNILRILIFDIISLVFAILPTEYGKYHRNQTISRKGANIISRRPSHGHLVRRCCPQAFLRIFSEVTYIRTLGNSTLLKIYALPNHTITIGVCILETQLLGLLYGGGAIVSCRNGPCRGCLLIYRSLFYIV
jgi:hypothetical protein